MGFPDGSSVANRVNSISNVGEKPTVILYTQIIDIHAGTPGAKALKESFIIMF